MGSADRLKLIVNSVLAAMALALISSASATAAAPYDDLPGESLGDSPYASAAVFDQTTPLFDTSAFTVQQSEINAPGAYLACGGWGSKDGWVRFATAVKGNLVVNVSKTTPGDLFYRIYTASTTNPTFADLSEIGCSDGLFGPEETYSFGYEVPASKVVFVQALMECRPIEPACSEGERDAAEGGPTKVRFRFTPSNADGDSAADSLDGCPAVSGAFRGCPDGDGDGIGSADDSCPAIFGRGTDGCRRPDEDGDGAAAVARGGGDCNDDNPAIGPSARDRPQNGVDENCDGRDSAYPRVQNEVERVFAYSTSAHRTVGFLKPFKVAGPLVKGMVVRLRCKGRGCPFSRLAVAVAKTQRGGLVIGEGLVRKRLDPGASVTLIITRPGYVGKALRFTTRNRGSMKIETLCVPVGTTALKQSCA